MIRVSIALLFSVTFAGTVWLAAGDDTNYPTYKDAAAAGAKAVRAGDLASAREPLEAAARLATTDREKLEAHRALLIPYRELKEIEPMQRAGEFVVANSTQSAERSLVRSSLVSFIHKRGKLDAAITGYEDRLKKDPAEGTALYLLVEAYSIKKDPAKAAEVGEKFAALEDKAGKPLDAGERAKLAENYARAGKSTAAAEMFEKISPLDPRTEGWYLKEAAAAWMKDGNKEKALAAARKSAGATPEARSEILNYFWRRGLGDVLFDAGEPGEAVVQFEQALAVAKLDAYARETKLRLEKAKSAANKP